jgi:hypothetical protein
LNGEAARESETMTIVKLFYNLMYECTCTALHIIQHAMNLGSKKEETVKRRISAKVWHNANQIHIFRNYGRMKGIRCRYTPPAELVNASG